jgi:glutamate 5-kinase
MAARKQWLADHLKLTGRIVLDHGAALAVRERGTSLLPVGVTAIDGDFLRGEAVACVDQQGESGPWSGQLQLG